jgi:hypothetical protein
LVAVVKGISRWLLLSPPPPPPAPPTTLLACGRDSPSDRATEARDAVSLSWGSRRNEDRCSVSSRALKVSCVKPAFSMPNMPAWWPGSLSSCVEARLMCV